MVSVVYKIDIPSEVVGPEILLVPKNNNNNSGFNNNANKSRTRIPIIQDKYSSLFKTIKW